MSPDGQSVYVTNILNGSVSQYDVGAGGQLSPKSPATVAAGVIPRVVAVSPDGQSVYVTDAAANHVVQYDVGAGGKLSPKSPAELETGVEPYDVAVSPAAPVPASKSQCKHGGWKQFGFKSQGRCIAFVHRGPRH